MKFFLKDGPSITQSEKVVSMAKYRKRKDYKGDMLMSFAPWYLFVLLPAAWFVSLWFKAANKGMRNGR